MRRPCSKSIVSLLCPASGLSFAHAGRPFGNSASFRAALKGMNGKASSPSELVQTKYGKILNSPSPRSKILRCTEGVGAVLLASISTSSELSSFSGIPFFSKAARATTKSHVDPIRPAWRQVLASMRRAKTSARPTLSQRRLSTWATFASSGSQIRCSESLIDSGPTQFNASSIKGPGWYSHCFLSTAIGMYPGSA